MNGFQKEYWVKQAEIGKENWRYNWPAWPLSTAINFILFMGTDHILLLLLKILLLGLFFRAVIEAVFDLPDFYISEDRKNLVEVRLAMILAPFITYIFAVTGHMDQFDLSIDDILSLVNEWVGREKS